jgi:hypothetical protein
MKYFLNKFSGILLFTLLCVSCTPQAVRLIGNDEKIIDMEVVACNDTIISRYSPFTGSSQRAAMWGSMVVFNEDDERWHLVYVCYKTKPNEPNIFYTGYDGIIQHAVSTVKGIDGIDGPYEDTNVLMRYDENPDAWEGLQGTDSFFPYKTGKKWLAFYGSATTQDFANCQWQIGLAQADRMEGPWTRMSELNPVNTGGLAENLIFK